MSATVARPETEPGAAPLVNSDLPMELATVKSPAVVSCQTPVAIAAGVGGVV
jgi:hypothetical protein